VVHQALAPAVEGLNVLLLKRLGWHEPHVRLPGCTADSCSVVAIVLLVLREWLYVLRGNDPNSMPRGFELTLPVKSACAGFDCNSACW
jgi:hypothetical protein